VPIRVDGTKVSARRPNMKFADLKKDYVTNLRYGRKAAETTCMGYQSHLNHYERYLASEGYGNSRLKTSLVLAKSGSPEMASAGLSPPSARSED